MLDMTKVAQALAAKRDLFARYGGTLGATLEGYRQEWLAVASQPRAEIEAQLAARAGWPGARPTAEHDRFQQGVVAFGPRWQNHQQSRAWAREILEGVTTIAADGSQIVPSKDYTLPVGAVQIGWFENPHRTDERYVKDVSFTILAPQELAGEPDGPPEGFPNREVGWRRFAGECACLAERMRAWRGRTPPPVCLFDGSLIVSFVAHLQPKDQARYVQAVSELLAASEESRVPLVGYVDTSYASDLVAMLDTLAGRGQGQRPADSAMLRPLMQWGDRTPAWLCARQDAVVSPAGPKYYDRVGFIYLKTTSTNAPARIEFPRWLLDDGSLDRVVDVVRAECVIGNGYPYAAETADAVAVITAEDRERFYAALQRFAEAEGLPFRFSRKARSKRGRR